VKKGGYWSKENTLVRYSTRLQAVDSGLCGVRRAFRCPTSTDNGGKQIQCNRVFIAGRSARGGKAVWSTKSGMNGTDAEGNGGSESPVWGQRGRVIFPGDVSESRVGTTGKTGELRSGASEKLGAPYSPGRQSGARVTQEWDHGNAQGSKIGKEGENGIDVSSEVGALGAGEGSRCVDCA